MGRQYLPSDQDNRCRNCVWVKCKDIESCHVNKEEQGHDTFYNLLVQLHVYSRKLQ